MEVFEKINKKQYLHLRHTGVIPRALPSRCVLVVKPKKDGKPNWAKSRSVVLGDFEDRYYSKPQRYAPVPNYFSLHIS